ncbi:hypothetical protein RhiirA4_451458 [Rhizophagus irregularis]|uniref:Uncharacterized protein n=1 Tax=Rhizophagus irregularis TaxID=588596 RepID=A0A2I1FVR3_9GLOM|nr:hypothetical protein RhiirA4_451458 [Rhizophagus irregularis]
MFLDQIITIDSAYLLDYQKIKSNLQNKHGSFPRWYNFLKEHITLTNAGRLNFDLGQQFIQNPQIQRPRIPPTNNKPIHHQGRPKWISFWSNIITDVAYERILTSTYFLKRLNPLC